MLRTLHGRLTLVFAGLLLPASILFVAITLTSAHGYYQEITQEQHVKLAEMLVKQSDIMRGDTLDQNKLDNLTSMLAMTNPGVEIYVLNRLGNIISSSASLTTETVELGPVERFVEGVRNYPLRGTDPRRRRPAIFSAAPLPGGEGFLYVVLNNDLQNSIVQSAQTSTVLRLGLWGSLITLVILLLGAALGFTLLTRRLRRLRMAMTDFRANDFSASGIDFWQPPPIRDEIDDVQAVFIDMAGKISEQIEALKRADEQRRELLTNLSHDLRTPLAALQGYLETLALKGEALPLAEQQTFLAAARRHGTRLNKLISDLFELTTLESGREQPNIEVFPLTELVQDIAMTYQIEARKKELELVVEGDRDLPFIRADIGLIERVITNLLDNAIRHTPPAGRITLGLSRLKDTVEIRVCDSGEGIAEEALPHIFDRFFQAKRQGSDKAGTGLGLAISKRILELHGQPLHVASRPSEGTRFWFELPFS